MSFLLNALVSGYEKLEQWGDPRVKNYPLMGSPIACLTILFLYLYFIFDYGPKLMKDKRSCDINKVIISYNIIQMIFNFAGIMTGVAYYPLVSFFCTPIDKPDMTFIHYLYFLLKVLDLVDTIFFVLRKRYAQITFLHLYHHIIMMLGSWVSCKYFPGGQLFFLGFINCFVHLVMYFYYFLTSWDPAYKKSIWWKRHLTQLQITQHCIVFVSFLVPLLNQNCTYPKPILACYLPWVGLMIYLFTDFYTNAYVKKVPVKNGD